MPQEIMGEPWYRCVRCRAMFKLKNLIIRHLIIHKVHRFENENDSKCVQDWERVRLVGGSIVKVDLPKEEICSGLGIAAGYEVHSPQQTSWVLGSSTSSSSLTPTQTTLTSSGSNSNSILTLITVANPLILGEEHHSYVGPFDPIISQTFLKFDETSLSGIGVGQSRTVEDVDVDDIINPSSSVGVLVDLPSTEDLYRCRYCSAPFAHSRSRAVHEAKVHNEQIDGYPCQICQKNFPTIASVQDHYRCTHKLTPPVKKAWKLWKTHGGDIQNYVQSPQRNSNPYQITLTPQQQPQTLQLHHHHTLSPLTHDDICNEVVAEVIVMGSLDQSSSHPHQVNVQHHPQYDSYYINTENGPITVTTSQAPSTIMLPMPIHKSSTKIIHDIDTNFDETLPNLKKKRGRKSKKDSNKNLSSVPKTKKQKSKEKSSLPSNLPKLAKDSPFRYQRLKCPKCETRFRTQWEQTVHLGLVHADYSCEFCSLVFMEKVEMVRHQYTVHNTELGYYQCHFCRKNFGSPRIVQEHVHSEHPGDRVPSTSVALKWRRA